MKMKRVPRGVVAGLVVVTGGVVVVEAMMTSRMETTWRRYKTPTLVQGPEAAETAVVLVHGFGSSGAQWRASLEAVASSGRRCYAVNLLGLGEAEKPKEAYSTELWASQVGEFVESVVRPRHSKVVLAGNSLGSVVSLAVACEQPVAGVALFNCAIGMNSKAKPLDFREAVEWPVSWLAQPVFALLDILLKIPAVAHWLFSNIKDPDTVKQVLTNVYVDSNRVDDQLLDSFLRPAADPGALDAFVAIYTGDPGPRPETLAPYVDAPIACFWGDKDLVTPIDGPVAKFFRRNYPQHFTVLHNTGHCPFDDDPDAANAAFLDWLDRIIPPSSSSSPPPAAAPTTTTTTR